jgi:hypothetical protein
MMNSKKQEDRTMKPKLYALAVGLMIAALLADCGGSEADQASREAEVAAAVQATLTAAAPPPTAVVVTMVVTSAPSPAVDSPAPVEPTASATPRPPSGEEPAVISVEPGGGGDYATLADAIRNAPPGTRIVLEAGLYILEEAITVDRPLTLEGAGRDQTIITSSVAEHVLKFKGSGPFSATEITFRHQGEQPADVVVVLGGEIGFRWCTFAGAVFSEAAGYGGNGLVLGGSTVGNIEDCRAAGNQQAGILLLDQARSSIMYSFMEHNGSCGIGYYGQATGYAGNNKITQNTLYGICVNDAAMPVLEVNTCRHNEQGGIAYFGQTGGEARGNDCSLNGHSGISILGQARPLLESNDCFANGQADIAYYENAGGTAGANRCSTDSPHGLYVGDSAKPTLANNQCPLSGAAVQEGESKTPEPQYNPDSWEGLGPTCFNQPAVSIDREWQTSAGGQMVMRGESVPLSLRNKWGEPGEKYDVMVRVIAPDGTETFTFTTLTANTEAVVTYPGDLVGASTDLRGTYTVIWEIDLDLIACNGFVVTGGGG